MTTPTIPGLAYFTEKMQKQTQISSIDVLRFVNEALTFKLPQVIKAPLNTHQLEQLVEAVHTDMRSGYSTLENKCEEHQWFHVQEALAKIRVVQIDIVNAVTQLGQGVMEVGDINWRL